MAKYEIEHVCGHAQTHQIFGPDTAEWGRGGRTRRQVIADRLAEGLCTGCWREHVAEQRAQAGKDAALRAVSLGLPPLTGTDQQRSWAERLRMDLLDKVIEMMSQGPAEVAAPAIVIWTGTLRSLPDQSAWWIENQGPDARRALQQALSQDDSEVLKALRDLHLPDKEPNR